MVGFGFLIEVGLRYYCPLLIFPKHLILSWFSFVPSFLLRERKREVAMASLPDIKKLMLKHQSLKQDFDDLFIETRALKAKFRKAKAKKLRFLAEVRFLRRRHKLLTSDYITLNIKGNNNQVQKVETSSGRKCYKDEDVAAKRNWSLLDLNKASEQVENEEVQVVWEPLSLDKAAKKGTIESDPLENHLKLSICRGIDNGLDRLNGGAEQTGKRKILW